MRDVAGPFAELFSRNSQNATRLIRVPFQNMVNVAKTVLEIEKRYTHSVKDFKVAVLHVKQGNNLVFSI